MSRIITFLSLLIVVTQFLVILPSSAQILIEDPSRANRGVVPGRPYAQAESESEAPRTQGKTGKAAATDYFKKREKSRESSVQREVAASGGGASGDRVLMLHIGTFINDKAYRWGKHNSSEDPGEANIGVTYRIGEWRNSMDLFFRAEVMSYDIDDERPVKLSLMPILAFPDSRSNFPLYFGAGAGVGVFFRQAGDESDLSFDYALLIGARFPEMFDSGGLFFETGLKGQVHLLSSGQHDGVFLSAGYMFSF